MDTDQVVHRIREIEAEWRAHFTATCHQFYGVDFAYLAHIDGQGAAKMLAGTLRMAAMPTTTDLRGESGPFAFRHFRLHDQPAEFFNLLVGVVTGEHTDEVLRSRPLVVQAANCSSLRGALVHTDGPHDKIEMYLNQFSLGSRDVLSPFNDELLAGTALPGHHLRGEAALRKLLRLPPLEGSSCTKLLGILHRPGRLHARRDKRGQISVSVTLPARANLEHAKLVVHEEPDLEAREVIGLQGIERTVNHGVGELVLPWSFGPRGSDTITLLFAGRELDRVTVNDVSAAAHTYLHLDPNCERLRTALFPTDPVLDQAQDHSPIAHTFEKACGVLFAILGFHVTWIDMQKTQGDWHLRLQGDAADPEVFVECSLRAKDLKKLKELEAVALYVAENFGTAAHAVVMTPAAVTNALQFEVAAAGHSVRVVRRNKIEQLLALALDPSVSDRATAALAVMGVTVGW